MKLRWKIAVGVAVVGVVAGWLVLHSDRNERTAVEQTRRELRQQGFKTDLSDFNFATPAEFHAREAALTNNFFNRPGLNQEDYARLRVLQGDHPQMLAGVGTDAALVTWKTTPQPDEAAGEQWPRDFWTALREACQIYQAELDAACTAALSGPIRFNLNASHGSAMLLRHCAVIKQLSQTLGKRAMLELHDGHQDSAWTNWLATTRLVTAWEPEPTEVSHLVRFGCAGIVYNLTWQALQSRAWTEAQLAQLQREWESVAFFEGLPETAAFARASAVALCQQEREQPSPPFNAGMSFKEMVRSPQHVWPAYRERMRRVNYRLHGSYEDEKALLLHFRDRELELRQAIQAQTWSAMQQLPGVTNLVLFLSQHASAMQCQLNVRQLALAWQMYSTQASPGRPQSFLSRAAEAEARRRIIITALALERHRLARGAYPKTLAELAPTFLKQPLVDFMDGQPLRYRLGDDGRFALYSTGLDCTDDGGQMPKPRLAEGLIPPMRPPSIPLADRRPQPFRTPLPNDLVWPRPASPGDQEVFEQEQIRIFAESTDQSEEAQAAAQWEFTARRQAKVEKILAARQPTLSAEPAYQGRALAEVLCNASVSGTNRLTLQEMLTLKPIITGDEPEVITFEVPVAFDVLTNFGSLELLVDREDASAECPAGWAECRRASNGNCLVVWNTIYETPGKHALQLELGVNEPAKPDEDYFLGPLAPFVVSNLCQFSLSSAYFNPAIGGTFRAKLPEARADYTVEINLPSGERVRKLTGSTSNGLLKVFWDLRDDPGRRSTNNAYNSVFHLNFPESGRRVTMKGP